MHKYGFFSKISKAYFLSSTLDALLSSSSRDVFTGSLAQSVQELWPIITSRTNIGTRAVFRGLRSTKTTEMWFLFRSATQCMLQVSGNVLKQVETFKYLRVFLLGRTKRLIHEFVKQTYCSNAWASPFSSQNKNFQHRKA